jgi:hypothetical protein
MPPKNSYQVFVSHSHKDRELAGDVKSELGRYGLNAFVAHDDISPTLEWQSEILKRLKECDVFLAILTKEFELSEWTDQETGIAIAFNKMLVPINVDATPYGFLAKYQALKWRADKPEESFADLAATLYNKQVIGKTAMIEAFAKSGTYRHAEQKSRNLSNISDFTTEEINKIAEAAVVNNQIYVARDAKTTLNELFSKYQNEIKPSTLAEWKRMTQK